MFLRNLESIYVRYPMGYPGAGEGTPKMQAWFPEVGRGTSK